ncbi:TonB-dependent receptor [Terriglobus saanensis]|uniref:TonB-dependent receptor, plug n=1 Tax=Terriglobus saanensis (strain ATCC BAA-1853 / DSM 23119 / SP1PR4) TaxID=401053 RepID=E8V417_TERSS|nr:TonB-dependent receptor [Terriglobus saanensis]ADV82508.1 TonB-dependent receptor, plug [Terriglobus saanensis SP1PR4]
MRTILKSLHYLAVALLLVCSVSGLAQTITGGVNGTVTDPAGAIIPNAKVTATNVATNVSTVSTTTSSGTYNIRNLQIGQYKVIIEASGFSAQTLGPFTLESGQDAKFDAKLGLEGSNTAIAVNESLVPLLNTENATLGATLDENAISNITLVSRNFTQLTLFVPGAVTGTPASFTGSAAIERNGNGTLASQNGNRQETNNYLLDGVEINETINNGIGYNPSPDALGQVRVISSNANAEFGNVGGGDVVALLKSGSNTFHGSAFFYLANYNMDANSWANKNFASSSAFVPKTPYTQSTFGGTVGGPIIKDKLFFFGDYEGIRYHSAGTGLASVATARMRSGDFGELLDPTQIATTVQLYNTQAAGQPAYAGNLLGAVSNPVAAYLFAHPEVYPLPNHTATVGTLIQNNYQAPTKTNRYNNQYDVKIDWKASPRDSISGRYSWGRNGDFTTPVLAITFPGANINPFQSFAFNSVHTFNARLINEFTAGFTRVVALGGLPSDSTGTFGLNGNAVVGISGVAQPYNGFILQSFTGTNGAFSSVGNSATGTTYYDNTFSYYDNLTYQAGQHTIKLGVQFLRYQQNTFYPGNDGAVGRYLYSGAFSAQNGTVGGYTLADFYQNHILTRAIGGVTGLAGQRSWRDAAFVQDDWKVSPRLTLNLGLRWEYDQPILEVNNKQANINFATKTVQLAGVNGASRGLYNPVWTNFMPRIGFSFNPSPRVVVRGGYGITTYFEGTGANLRLNFNYPFQNGFTATGFAPSTTSAGQFYTTAQGFGTANTSCNIQTSTVPCTTTIRAWDQAIKPMFLQQYSLTAEYQLSNTASLTFGYVGETGQHLITAGAANALPKPCIIGGVVQTVLTSAQCIAADPAPFINLVGQTGSVVFTASNAMENYNALQATFRQRLSKGLEFTANYAYAKAMTNSTGFFGAQGINGQSAYAQNFYDNHSEYGPAAQDVRHNINGHLTYELPVGRGRMFGTNMNRAIDEVIGGWKVAMTTIVYTGFPVNINSGSNNSNTANNSQRANHYRKLNVVNRSAQAWFGTDPSVLHQRSSTTAGAQCSAAGVDDGVCAYGQPAAGTFGTASVDSERAPGYQSADASIFKDFAITEAHKISFRADAANVFNITSLGNPTNNAQSATFGQITASRSQARQLQLSAKYSF